MLIVFEGIDNSGKSTQSKLFYEYLLFLGHNTILTKEPVDTIDSNNIANYIRKILTTNGNHDDIDAESELLLMNLSRREHIKKLIKPALENKKYVICDRFIDSTLAYQGLSIENDFILNLHNQFCYSLYPDMVFLIDIDPEIALKRKLHEDETRFENKGIDYLINTRNKFLKVAKQKPSTHIIIDGNKSINEIHNIIIANWLK